MDGVHPPRCVEWRWCALLLSCPVQWCGLVPYSSHCSTHQYCCHVVHCSLPGVWCVGVCLCVCGVRVVGYPLSALPLVVVEGGAIVDGGWHGEGRATVLPASPSNVGVPRLCVGVPLVVHSVALLNGGGGMCCAALSSDWVRHLVLSYSLSYCLAPLPLLCVCCHSIVGLGLCLCDRVVSLWNGGEWVAWSCHLSFFSSVILLTSLAFFLFFCLCWCSG